jgi:hypothetical protein
MLNTRASFWVIVAATFFMLAQSTMAAPLHMMDVKCGDEVLGRMEIDTYATGEGGTGTGADPFTGFVDIRGKFVPGAGAAGHTFHYIQAAVRDDRPPAYADGTAITAPYIDPPPGGYNGAAFDRMPYYDQGEFPTFGDKPEIFLNFTKNQADMQRELEFETWIVCVIDETFGATANRASDDTFKVAPLLGWRWGFEQTYADAAPVSTDGLNDITQTIVPFAFLGAAPSANWTAALGRVYGTNPNQDRFNVTIGDCTECIPEPTTLVLMLCLSSLGIAFGRRRAG